MSLDKKLQIGIEDKLAITEFNGETQPNLDSVISHYAQSLNQTNLRFLGGYLSCHNLFYMILKIYNKMAP